METRIDGREGWVEVTRAEVHVLAKGDDSLRERLETALDQAGDESPVDVVTDELTTGGVRRTPDFAIVDAGEGRVLARGTAAVQITGAAGEATEVGAPSRGPWADEDLDPGTQAVVLSTGEPEPAPAGPQLTEDGWAIPSVFAGGAGAAGAAGAASAAEPAVLDEPAPVRGGAEGDDELPADDFLFGAEDQHRGTLQQAGETPVDSGPVAAAGGYQPPENPADATLAPIGTEEHAVDQPAEPGGAADVDQPAEAGEAAGGDESTPGEVSAASPQFVDGHLVSGRAAHGSPARPAAEPAGAEPSGASAVAPGVAAAAGAAAPAAASHPGPGAEPGHGAGPGAEGPAGEGLGVQGTGAQGPGADRADDQGLFTQIIEGDPDVAADTEPTGADDTGELPDGPVVLAVRCAQGHHSAPHATRCRVCGQELPTQQPEPTVRPALGVLRLTTGDVVTLDRGVLIGRAPRAAQETEAEGTPHLVRVASPDNEISRNHVEVVLDGWHVLVRDLGSTNGTTVALPGSSPVRVRPDDQQAIEPGTTVTLADQVSMVFEITG